MIENVLIIFLLFFLERAKQILKKCQDKCSRTSTTSAPRRNTFISLKPLPAVISVIGCSRDTNATIKRDLEGILQKQLVEREVDVLSFSRLDAMELDAVQAKVKLLEISMEYRGRQSSVGTNDSRAGNTARGQSGSGGDVYVLNGLKEDVLSVTELVSKAVQKALCEDIQDKEEAMLALNVQWSIQDVNKDWHELTLHDNFLLEGAHMNNQVSVDITAPDCTVVKVNLRTQDATNWLTGVTYKVKRHESEIGMSHLLVSTHFHFTFFTLFHNIHFSDIYFGLRFAKTMGTYARRILQKGRAATQNTGVRAGSPGFPQNS